jgi:hypothetical protein
MSRLSTHLPSLGALVLAVALAGIAYSIYDGHSNRTTGGAASAGGAGLMTDSALRNPKPKPTSVHSPRRTHAARHRDIDRVTRMTPAVALAPAASSPVSAPQSSPAPNQGRSVYRTPRPPATEPGGGGPEAAPRPPKGGPPAKPTPKPKTPNVGTPGGSPPVQRPGDGTGGSPVTNPPVTSPPATNPPATDPVTAPADPEAGLDDLPVGGLDPTDLGEPVDETDTGAAQPPVS